MKKWLSGFAIGFLVLLLAACGDATEKPADVKPGTDAKNKSDLTVEEVFNKAQAASENIKSMHTDMDIEQTISAPEFGGEMESTIKLQMDLIQDPLAMYQTMDISMGDFGNIETEIYLTEAGMYMSSPMGDGWIQFPSDDLSDLQELINAGPETSIDYASLAEYVEDFTFEQNDDAYILYLKASGDKFTNLMQDQLASTGMMDEVDVDEEVLENMKVHQFEYEIFVDKKTFETTAFNLVMDMEISVEGETMRIKQDAKAKMSQINEITEIKIPEEVLENVVEY